MIWSWRSLMQRLSLCYLTRFQSVATGDVVFYLSLSFCAFCANNQYALYVCLNLSTKFSSSLLRSLLFSQNQLSQIRRGINFIVQSSIRARTSLLFYALRELELTLQNVLSDVCTDLLFATRSANECVFEMWQQKKSLESKKKSPQSKTWFSPTSK